MTPDLPLRKNSADLGDLEKRPKLHLEGQGAPWLRLWLHVVNLFLNTKNCLG